MPLILPNGLLLLDSGTGVPNSQTGDTTMDLLVKFNHNMQLLLTNADINIASGSPIVWDSGTRSLSISLPHNKVIVGNSSGTGVASSHINAVSIGMTIPSSGSFTSIRTPAQNTTASGTGYIGTSGTPYYEVHALNGHFNNIYYNNSQIIDISPYSGLVVYISPTGNDSNDGRTSGTAFQTLERALNQIARSSSRVGTVIALSGTYPSSSTILYDSIHFFLKGSGPTDLSNSKIVIYNSKVAAMNCICPHITSFYSSLSFHGCEFTKTQSTIFLPFIFSQISLLNSTASFLSCKFDYEAVASSFTDPACIFNLNSVTTVQTTGFFNSVTNSGSQYMVNLQSGIVNMTQCSGSFYDKGVAYYSGILSMDRQSSLVPVSGSHSIFEMNYSQRVFLGSPVTGSTLPPQATHNGKVLTTNGSSAYWSNVLDHNYTVTGNLTVEGNIYCYGDVYAFYSSDERLKRYIQRLPNALVNILSLTGIEFEWQDGRLPGKDYGITAQQLESILPQAVVTRADGYKAINYRALTALLIEAVKELAGKVSVLESRLGSEVC